MLQIMYEPLTFGGCFTNMVTLAALVFAFFTAFALLFRRLARSRPVFNWLALGFGGLGVAGAATVVFVLSTTGTATYRVALGDRFLEHRFCDGLQMDAKTYPLTDIMEKKYRRTVIRRSGSPNRISHYLDIFIAGRDKPLVVELDSALAKTDLALVSRFAPEAYAQYEANRHKRR